MLSSAFTPCPSARDGMLANMPLIWVQYWTALPIVVEDQAMTEGNQSGRLPSGGHPVDISLQGRLADGESNVQTSTPLSFTIEALQDPTPAPFCADGQAAEFSTGNSPYGFPQQSTGTHQQYPTNQPFNSSLQYAAAGSQDGSGGFNMMGMAAALPEYATKQSLQSHSRLPPGSLVASPSYQGQQMSHFAGQIPMNNQAYPTFPTQYGTPYQQSPGPSYPQMSPAHQSHMGVQTTGQTPYNNNHYFMNPSQQLQYYPGQLGQPGQAQHGQGSPYTSSFSRPSGQAYGQGAPDHETELLECDYKC